MLLLISIAAGILGPLFLIWLLWFFNHFILPALIDKLAIDLDAGFKDLKVDIKNPINNIDNVKNAVICGLITQGKTEAPKE